MKATTGFNILAGLAMICATAVVLAGKDLTFATGIVGLAFGLAGRGKA